MIYADFEFYKTQYQGVSIANDDFPRLALRASEYVDDATNYRAEAYYVTSPTRIQLATCAVAEVVQMLEKRQEALLGDAGGSVANNIGAIKNESVGGHSISYQTDSSSYDDIKVQSENEIRKVITRYLFQTGLLCKWL